MRPSSPITQYTERAPLCRVVFLTTHTQRVVRPINAMAHASPAFSRVAERSVLNTDRPEIICPQPIHPLPKWIDTTEREDDKDETTPEEDEERSELTPDSEKNGNGADW